MVIKLLRSLPIVGALLLSSSLSSAWVFPSVSQRLKNNVKLRLVVGKQYALRPSKLFQSDTDEDDGWTEPAAEVEKPVPPIESQEEKLPSEERDLFIPIFALVSLLGLFGSYGYEMMRLASRGELYLPWSN